MRIRKRFGPLGFSSITTTTTTIALSDPPLTSTTRKHEEEEEEEEEKKRLHPSFEDENQPFDQVYQTSKTSSDLELTFIRGKNGWICCSDDRGGLVEEEEEEEEKDDDDDQCMMMNTNPTHKMNKEFKGLKEEEEDEMMIRNSTSTTATKNRRSNSLGGEEEVTNFGSGVPTFSSNISSHDDLHQVLLHEMWCEGVLKGFPMKKRRGSNCERKVLLGDDQEITRTTAKTTEMIKQKKIMKTTNPNKKWPVVHEKDSQEITDSTTSSPKKKKNEEGSRCSRINGRGWRCCQQALVGYSLCEHHSGKGRMFRSMNSARNRSTATSTGDAAELIRNVETPVSLKCHGEDDDDDDDEAKTSTTMMRIENKKRKKTGMVKARSISSLLGQPQVHDDYVKV